MTRSMVLCLSLLTCSGVYGASVPEDVKQLIHQRVASIAPGLKVDDIGYAPMKGFYEVSIGARLVYFSEDGKYLLLGELIDTETQENLTETRKAEITGSMLAEYSVEEMIVIGPDNPKRFITVFTDVDCPYCAKFHRDVPGLNEAGVQVRYLLFPRTGIGGRSYQRAVGVWCADDRIEAVGVAKAGGEVEFKQCSNPVEQHYQLGQEVGIRGTPAIILDDGQMIGGYVPPDQLISELGLVSE